MRYLVLIYFSFLLFSSQIFAQNNVGIGTSTPNPDAILELNSVNKGFLMPRIASGDTAGLGKPSNAGLILYSNSDNVFFYYDGSTWQTLSAGINNWGNIGNDIYNLNSGFVGIGTTTPTQALTVSGTGPIGVLVQAGGNAFLNLEAGSIASTSNLNFRFAATLRGRIRYNYNVVQANETMDFTVNSNTGITINGFGDVGIGITSPTQKLHINSGGVATTMRLDNTVAGNTIFDVYNNGVLGTRYQTTGTQTNILSQSTRDINLFTNGNNRMTIDGSNGYVGISNSNPLADLHISPTDGGNGDLAIGTSATTDFWNMAMTNGNNRFVMAYNNGAFNDYLIMSNTGNMGIGTTFPLNRLDVEGGAAIGSTFAGTNTAPTNGLIVEGNFGLGIAAPIQNLHIFDASNPAILLASSATTGISNLANSGAVYMMENSGTPGVDANGGAIRYDGSANVLKLEMYNGATTFEALNIERGSGDIGIGLTNPSKNLHVVSAPTGTFDAAIYASSVTTNNAGFFGAMVYDQGTTNFGIYAHSDALPNTFPLGANRAADGALVGFYSAGILEGQINVIGNTISYGAFTGVHYANSIDESLKRGTLVSLNGQNGNLHDRESSEIIYGVSKTAKANDSKVMGTFLGLMDPYGDKSSDNPYQIMAVGNGDMWIVDNGTDLKVGDYLISSDLPGYAMLDKGDFDIAHIIAKSGEDVNWNDVMTTSNGRKVFKVSVFFETFEINHKADQLANKVQFLENRTREIEAKLQNVIDLMGTQVINK